MKANVPQRALSEHGSWDQGGDVAAEEVMPCAHHLAKPLKRNCLRRSARLRGGGALTSSAQSRTTEAESSSQVRHLQWGGRRARARVSVRHGEALTLAARVVEPPGMRRTNRPDPGDRREAGKRTPPEPYVSTEWTAQQQPEKYQRLLALMFNEYPKATTNH